jgi:hypothetical protein
VNSLGNLVSDHPIGRWGPLYLVLAFALEGAALFIMGYAWTIHFPPGFRPFLGFAFAFALLGGVILYRWLIYRESSVAIYERGFVVTRGRKARRFAWGEIASVTQRTERVRVNGIPGPRRTKVSVRLVNGRRIKIPDRYQGIMKLAENLQIKMAAERLPKVIEQIERGETVSFGAFKVSRKHVSRFFKKLRWAEVESVQVVNGQVIVRRKGHWPAWSAPYVFQVENLYVLLQILQRLGVRVLV